MDIGPALAEARTKAGMTIQDVSERTRIRGKLISDIEHDDYSACGGDFYTRGHIRAIAKAVGADPVPLIEQYDGNAAAAAAPESAVRDPEPAAKPQTTWPKTTDSARPAPRPEARRGPRQGRSVGHGPRAGGVQAADEDSGADGESGVSEEPGPDRSPRAGAAAVVRRPAAGGESAAGGQPAVRGESAADDQPSVRAESAAGGESAAEPGPALWQQPIAEEPGSQPLLGVATDRLRQSADNVRRASADAYRQSVPRVRQAGTDAYRRTVPQARRAGEQARRAGEEAVRRAAPLVRNATSSASGRIGRVRTTDRRLSVLVGASVVVLAGLIILTYLLVSGSSPASGHAASGARHQARSVPVRPSRRPASAHSHASSPHVASPASGRLRPVTAAAFGPGGTAQGDNPQQAPLALTGQNGGWHTNWYATADFGNLQSGTGLLLSMGGPVTVTQARIELGPVAGGTLELRAGNQPVLADLLPVARSADTGGTVTLAPSHPVAARYVLIWFTRLPPDSAGTFQATIYHVNLTGYS